MKYTISLIALLLYLILNPEISSAQNNSGLQFLSIGPNAYSLSLSEAHTAVPIGSAAMFTNPANLVLNSRSSLSASHTLWIGDTQHTQASASIRRTKDAFAFGFLTSGIDDITVRTTAGPSEGSFDVRYLAVSAAYARQFGIFSAGATASYIYEQFFQSNASGYGFNMGITATLLDERLRIGTSLNNVGEMGKLVIKQSELPTVLRAGIDLNAIQFSAFSGTEIPVLINFSADFVTPLNETKPEGESSLIQSGDYLAFGVNAQLYDMISIRGGYRTGNTARNWSMGAGISIDPITFNYAFVPFETGFGSVHSISLLYFFDF